MIRELAFLNACCNITTVSVAAFAISCGVEAGEEGLDRQFAGDLAALVAAHTIGHGDQETMRNGPLRVRLGEQKLILVMVPHPPGIGGGTSEQFAHPLPLYAFVSPSSFRILQRRIVAQAGDATQSGPHRRVPSTRRQSANVTIPAIKS